MSYDPDDYHDLMAPHPGPGKGFDRVAAGFTHDSHPAPEGSRCLPDPGRTSDEVWTITAQGAVLNRDYPNETTVDGVVAAVLRDERISDADARYYDPDALTKRALAAMDKGVHLPLDPAGRKAIPIATNFLDYFPDAIVEVARVSKLGADQHGTVGWDRSKSTNEADTLMRHFLDRGKLDSDGQRHSAKVAWRALALLQKEIEADRERSR